MQLDIFEFTRNVPFDEVMKFKTGDKISMVIGSSDEDYKSDIVLENSEFIKVYDIFSSTIDSDKLRTVYVKIRFPDSVHEVSVPLLLIKKVYGAQNDAETELLT